MMRIHSTISNGIFGIILILTFLMNCEIALCGRRPYAFTFDTGTLKDGELELEEWLWSRVSKPSDNKASAEWLWFGPVYGLTPNLEVALPFEIVGTQTNTALADMALDFRIQFFDPITSDKRFVNFLARVYYQLNLSRPANIGISTLPWLGVDLIASFGNPKGSHATIDIGGYSDFSRSDPSILYQTISIGYSARLNPVLAVGLEGMNEASFGSIDPGLRRTYLGPDLAFSRNQIWGTLGLLFGVTNNTPLVLPKLIIGISI